MTPRRRLLALAPAGALLVGLSLLLPARTPPVYDGLPLQSEPYRYLQPPAGSAQTQAPASASEDVSVTSGSSEPFVLATSENPPQAQLIAGGDAVAAPAGQTRLTVTITPVQPPLARPAGGSVDGNVYRVAATAGGSPVPLRPGANVSVVLRGTGTGGTAAMQRFDGSAWSPLPTNRTSSDTYIANPHALGDFALVLAGGGGSSAGASSGGGGIGPGAIIGIAAAVLVVAGTLIGIRVARAR